MAPTLGYGHGHALLSGSRPACPAPPPLALEFPWPLSRLRLRFLKVASVPVWRPTVLSCFQGHSCAKVAEPSLPLPGWVPCCCARRKALIDPGPFRVCLPLWSGDPSGRAGGMLSLSQAVSERTYLNKSLPESKPAWRESCVPKSRLLRGRRRPL